PALCWPQAFKELANPLSPLLFPLRLRLQKYNLFPYQQALFSKIFHKISQQPVNQYEIFST
ncbi:MAG: hypothetical protein IJP44_09860, partial [Bacteroidales bacterium]|nr:hypothetical protein [Bacteroidales bacterium]